MIALAKKLSNYDPVEVGCYDHWLPQTLGRDKSQRHKRTFCRLKGGLDGAGDFRQRVIGLVRMGVLYGDGLGAWYVDHGAAVGNGVARASLTAQQDAELYSSLNARALCGHAVRPRLPVLECFAGIGPHLGVMRRCDLAIHKSAVANLPCSVID